MSVEQGVLEAHVDFEEIWRQFLYELEERRQKGGIINKLTLPGDIWVAGQVARIAGFTPDQIESALTPASEQLSSSSSE